MLNLQSPDGHLWCLLIGVGSMIIWNHIMSSALFTLFGMNDKDDLLNFMIGLIMSAVGSSSLFVRILPFSIGRLFLHNFRLIFFSILLLPKIQFMWFLCPNEEIIREWVYLSATSLVNISNQESLKINLQIMGKKEDFITNLEAYSYKCNKQLYTFEMLLIAFYLVSLTIINCIESYKIPEHIVTRKINPDYLTASRN